MKIAVTVERPGLAEPVDPGFGRAPCFMVIDSDNMSWEAVANEQSRELLQGAGIQAAQNLLGRSPEVLLTGNCGSEAFRVLQAGGVEVYVGVKGTAGEAVKRYLEENSLPQMDPM